MDNLSKQDTKKLDNLLCKAIDKGHFRTNREKALRQFLGLDDAQKLELKNDYYRILGTGEEYLVMTDEEAQQSADDYIRDSLWCFSPDFLLQYMPEGMTVEAIKAIQDKCEDGNEPLLKLVGNNLDDLILSAIILDTRGHFLSSYDGKEETEEVDGEEFYIYRTN